TNGFKYIDRPDHIDHCAKPRIRSTSRHLQTSQMNNVRHPEIFDDRNQGVRLSDVADNYLYATELVFIHDLAQSTIIRTTVKGHHTDAVRQQSFYNPRTDETVCTGNQKSLVQSSLPFSRLRLSSLNWPGQSL